MIVQSLFKFSEEKYKNLTTFQKKIIQIAYLRLYSEVFVSMGWEDCKRG